ncbi:MAG: DNA polymerase III subunit gamma and tau [Actinomycetes bacterium]
MSLALYRRYRPESFAEVIGQEHVTGPLQQALRNDRVHHAYLFSGPRGCGKTTSARILARALNCEQGPTPEPCGVCDSCVALARNGSGSLDVIEIDAASHNGVDDARDLRERAFFAPASSRFKIYIVDEAHMVTPQAFNALLKLVEEPPEHVKFVFATTEPEKVIGTIRSRTHHYPFRLVPPGTLTAYLADLCVREDIEVDAAVLPLVVQAGGGSVRDSLSVLDQLLAGAAAEGVTYPMATALLGFTDASLLDAIVDAFAAGDGAAAFDLVDRLVEAGHDPRRFVSDLLDRLRDLILVDAVPDAIDKGLVVGPPELLAALPGQSARFGRSELVRAAEIVNVGLTELRGATAPRLQLELICARVLLPAVTADEIGLAARVDRLERRFSIAGPLGEPSPPAVRAAAGVEGAGGVEGATGVAGPTGAPGRPVGTVPTPDARRQDDEAASSETMLPLEPSAAPASQERLAAAGPERPATARGPGSGLDAVEVRRLWPTVLERVKAKRRVTWMMLFEKVTVSSVDESDIVLAFPDAGSLAGFGSGAHDQILEAALLDALGVSLRVEAVLDPSRSASRATGSRSEPPAGASAPHTRGSQRRGPTTPGAGEPEPAASVAGPTIAPASAEAPPDAESADAVQGPERVPRRQGRAPGSDRPPEQDPDTGSAPGPGTMRAAYRRAAPLDDEPNPAEDPDADDGGKLSATDLLARELGATVVEQVEDPRSA